MDNNTILTEITKKVRLKGYNQKTLKAYLGNVKCLMEYFKGNLTELDSLQIEEYLLTLIQDAGHTASYVNQTASALSFCVTRLIL